jgi:nucleoside-diphosphate-sugar epimerase
MSRPRSVFLTGATGFLGSHLTARLLIDGHHVKVLARSSKYTSAEDRVRQILRDVGVGRFENLTVLEGDIGLPNLGLSEECRKQLISSIEEIWHCAASLSFQEEDRAKIFRMNVDGTLHVLDLVKMLPTRRLHHISTGYVAGNRCGIVLENEIDIGQTFKNPYEESKCRAEQIVAGAHRTGSVTASIYRPSIVIGDSKSGRVTHFHGVYAFIRALWTTLERLRRRTAQTGLVNLPLRVLGVENQTLNFVPIDYVVDGMLEISRREDSIGGTYHLTNPVPTKNGFWLPNICRILGVQGIRLVGESSFVKTPTSKLEALFQKQMAFYYQYLQGEPRFDCRRVLEALKNTGIQCPQVTVEFISKMMGWYVDFLASQAARAGLELNSDRISLS